MMRMVMRLLAGALVAASPAAAQDRAALLQQHSGGTLRITAESAPGSLDVQINYNETGWPFTGMLYDGLVAFKKTSGEDSNTLVPDLAEAMPELRDDGRTYVFKLRQGVKFSNGDDVTTKDVVASFQRLFKVGNPNSGSWFGDVVGAKACLDHPADCTLEGGVIGDEAARTVTVRLNAPDTEFLLKLGTPFGAVIPAGTAPTDLGTQLMPGTGPYMAESYDPGTAARFVRNPFFKEWSVDAQPAGFPDEIVESYGLENEAEVTAIENDQFDFMIDLVPLDRLGELSTKHQPLVHISSALETRYLALNTRIPPFDNLRARQALSYAVDRGAMVNLAGGRNMAAPLCQVLPSGVAGYEPYCPYTVNPGAKWSKPDMARARELMAASGTAGQKVTIFTDDLAVNRSIGAYLQSVMNGLGYEASVRSLSGNVHRTYIQNSGNKVQAAVTRWGSDYPAASDFLQVLFGCDGFHEGSDASINISAFCDKDIDASMRRALATEVTDPAAAAALWSAIDRRITDMAPAVQLFQPKILELTSARVGNYHWSDVYAAVLSQMWVQ